MNDPALTPYGESKDTGLLEFMAALSLHVLDETSPPRITLIHLATAACPFTGFIHYFEISLLRLT